MGVAAIVTPDGYTGVLPAGFLRVAVTEVVVEVMCVCRPVRVCARASDRGRGCL